jgi:hypothetical protein
MTDLQNRGVKDIFIACCDGLTGFPESIEAVFPKTQGFQPLGLVYLGSSLRQFPQQI